MIVPSSAGKSIRVHSGKFTCQPIASLEITGYDGERLRPGEIYVRLTGARSENLAVCSLCGPDRFVVKYDELRGRERGLRVGATAVVGKLYFIDIRRKSLDDSADLTALQSFLRQIDRQCDDIQGMNYGAHKNFLHNVACH